MKATILARGLATRMRAAQSDARLDESQAAAAAAGLKGLMPVGGRPFLDYALSRLADAGVRDAALVIGPEHDVVRDYYRVTAPPRRLRIAFVVQLEPRGTADAVLACDAWTGGSPFLVVNADNLYPVEVLRALARLDGPGLPAFERDDLVRTSNIPETRVAAFALLQSDSSGHLAGIVEKPGSAAIAAAGPRALVSMNCWRFDSRIFDACRDVTPSVRGELELPQAVSLAAARGVPFQIIPARGPVLDLSSRADVFEVERRLAGETPAP